MWLGQRLSVRLGDVSAYERYPLAEADSMIWLALRRAAKMKHSWAVIGYPRGQDESNLGPWLVTRAVKMKPFWPLDHEVGTHRVSERKRSTDNGSKSFSFVICTNKIFCLVLSMKWEKKEMIWPWKVMKRINAEKTRMLKSFVNL